MPSPNTIAPPPSAADFQLSAVNSRLFCCSPFRLIHFRENGPANPLVSHTFKTKDLKPFRFIHFQKNGRGGERSLRVPILSGGSSPNFAFRISIFGSQLSTVDSGLLYSKCFTLTYIRKFAPVNPYGSHTSKTKDLKPFRITYLQKKGTGGGGEPQPMHKAVVNVLGRALECSGRSFPPLCEEPW
jgi:hypothetical protein